MAIKRAIKASRHYFKYVGYILFDVVVVFSFSALFSFFFDFSWADPSNLFRETNEDFFSTKTFYQIKNYEEKGDTIESFVLADIEDLTSREKIASFIDSIYELNPSRIAIDLIFPSPQDSIPDRRLTQTVKKVKDKAVFACMLSDYSKEKQSFQSVEHSFFLNPQYDSYYLESLNEGYANLINDGTNSTVWKYSLVENCNGKMSYSLPAAVLFEDIEEQPHTEHIINYDKVRFAKVTPYYLPREMVEGNIVIVGAYRYSGDKFESPFGLIPGMLIHAYICQSENTDEIVEQSVSDKIVMTLICLFCFVILIVLIDCLIEFLPFKSISFLLQGGIMTLGISFMAVYLLMRYSYYLFTEDMVFTNGRAAINGILVMTSVVKVAYSSMILFLKNHNKISKITQSSIYQFFKVVD